MPAIAHYRTVQAQTASPERLTVMVLNAGLQHLRRAEAALKDKRFAEAHAALDKATEIVCALDGTFKEDAAPELARQLQEIYRFVAGRIALGAVNRDPKYVTEAIRAFAPIAAAFAEAAEKIGAGR